MLVVDLLAIGIFCGFILIVGYSIMSKAIGRFVRLLERLLDKIENNIR